jgi:hypothetical protein
MSTGFPSPRRLASARLFIEYRAHVLHLSTVLEESLIHTLLWPLVRVPVLIKASKPVEKAVTHIHNRNQR